jgi:transposase
MHDRVCPPKRMRFSFESRCRLVSLIVEGMSPKAAAAACGASRATGYRLWRRYREGGFAALADRPCTPRHQPRRLSTQAEREILHWRAELGAGPAVIAVIVERPASTVHKVLRRAGCSRLPRPGREHGPRYERARPGELLHVDTKKLGRFWAAGKRIHGDRSLRSRGARWQYLHVAVDDHSRLAYCELLQSERKEACAAFLERRPLLVPRAWDRLRARARGQREGLPLPPLAEGLRAARDRAPLHPRLLTLDERQGGSAHQDAPTRVGLPLRLSHERPPRTGARRLPPLVQPPPAARLARSPTTDQPRLTPVWSVQLDRQRSIR